MSEALRVLLVTSWDEACGIAEHSAMLVEAIEQADSGIAITAYAEALDPLASIVRSLVHDAPAKHGISIVHLNYQAALHSRWAPEQIAELRAAGLKVLVTYHDTGVPNSEQCKAIVHAADVAIVHEPFDDLPPEKTHYWRMGVLGWHKPCVVAWPDRRPVLGTVGFPFPWKCYDQLCDVTARAGWGLLLLAPGATTTQAAQWYARQPALIVRDDFIDRTEAVELLTGCDATAFTYVTHNTGQSGAICLGLAARKPVIALRTCRQFRALYEDPLGSQAIWWCESFEEVEQTLRRLPIQRVDPDIVALAEQDSWTTLGKKYAALYRELVS